MHATHQHSSWLFTSCHSRITVHYMFACRTSVSSPSWPSPSSLPTTMVHVCSGAATSWAPSHRYVYRLDDASQACCQEDGVSRLWVQVTSVARMYPHLFSCRLSPIAAQAQEARAYDCPRARPACSCLEPVMLVLQGYFSRAVSCFQFVQFCARL